MTPTIRPLTEPDLPQLHQMICALAAHHGDTPDVNPTQLRRDVFGPQRWFTVLVADMGPKGLVGYTALLPLGQLQMGARGMDMHHLFVRPACRGQGIGKALMDAAQTHCRSLGCKIMTVGTHPDNHAAAQFYQTHGFAPRPASGPRFSMPLDHPLT
ncbi:GNAT family N-acetyltransferase [uncultured Tateyamaria sp.]|uniref:GNAT family N-acetyltransferase n=1 Tax=uncultured Tateyamaria sp. TaxID=455651 RepID=UPI00261A3551|nr:GNAT family N-acetyltransferase [uncultured Tateyamaria sp.]